MRRLLLWFKQDLRLDDHPAVQAAVDAEQVLPLFVLDPALLDYGALGSRRLGVHRARFLLESLANLDSELRQRGSALLVLPGRADEVIPALVERFALQEVLTLEEIAPEERQQLAELRQKLGHIPLRELPGNNLLRLDELPTTLEALPAVYSQFCQQVEERLPVFQPLPIPERMPGLPDNALEVFEPLPVLSQLGLGEPLNALHSAFPFSGGEIAALARVRDYLWLRQGVRRYQDTRNGLIGSEYSSKFSPWLANGCLSPRRVIAELRRHESLYGGNASTQALWRALLWRDFFRWTLLRHGDTLFQQRSPHPLDVRFTQWCQGRTGMPLVDANMRELAATGFMSNRGRQVVARYLVHDLNQDWRHGAAWFEEHLLDYDPASNWGNWAYLASAASDPQRQQPFNTLRQARQYDPEGAYVSLWLPELRNVPAHLRHTPFLLSQRQLEVAGYPRLEQIPDTWRPYLPHVA